MKQTTVANPLATGGKPSPDGILRHIPALDGVRGAAILLVLICHYGPCLSSATRLRALFFFAIKVGPFGVDLFFVLSGFLITGILYDAKGSANYFRNFYARRFLRIFPLYYGFLALVLLCLLAISSAGPPDWRHAQLAHELWSYQPWLWTYTANIWMFAHNTWMSLVGTFWSLSIEEQFYLFWPLAVFFFGRRSLLWICSGICVLALGARLMLSAAGVGDLAVYVFTPCRFDALAAGAIVALLARGPAPERRLIHFGRVFLFSASCLIALLVLLRLWCPAFSAGTNKEFERDFMYTGVAFFFASLVIFALAGEETTSVLSNLFCLRWLRILGLYSYGIYIFHGPILQIARSWLAAEGLWPTVHANPFLGAAFAALDLAVVFAVAFASFNLFEKPALRLKRFFPEQQAAGPPTRSR